MLGASRYAATGGLLPLALTLIGLAGAVVYGLMLLPGSSYLEAAPDGLTISTAFRKRSYAWPEIESFYADSIATKQVIKYRLKLSVKEQEADNGQTREETLPDTYGMAAEELADQLNVVRRRYA